MRLLRNCIGRRLWESPISSPTPARSRPPTRRRGWGTLLGRWTRSRIEHAILKARCLLETTAGQGTALGWRFEQFAAILDRLKQPERLGLCFDTCHVFAAGYPMGTRKEYLATMAAFDRLVGLDRIKAFHLNDSRRELGSRIDRHEHIGRGRLGLEPFRLLLSDPRFRDVPMYLETPKGEENGEDLDVVNLRMLRTCIER